jgi:hypothetical protein
MISASLFSRVSSVCAAVAVALVLLCASPAQIGVQTASAQTPITCPNGQIVAAGQSCPTFTGNSCGTVSVSCSTNSFGCGTSFNGSSNLGCSGNFNGGCTTSLAGGSSCTASSGCGGSQLFGSGGGSSLFGGGCTGGGGGCVGKVLQAGQTCSNGVVSGTGTTTATTTGVTTSTTLAAGALNRSSTPLTCPGGGFAVGGACSSAPVSTAAQINSTAGVPVSAAIGTGFTVSLAQGWNIVAGPSGTTLPTSAFTWQAGDTAYETVAPGTPLKPGAGYWVNMLAAGQINLPTAPSSNVTVTIPAGGQVMIGNPGTTVATVTGADAVVTFDAPSSSWTPTTQLQPGQGGWASSAAGATVTITNAPTPGG